MTFSALRSVHGAVRGDVKVYQLRKEQQEKSIVSYNSAVDVIKEEMYLQSVYKQYSIFIMAKCMISLVN